jgi:uncharacterized membrane protein
VAALLPDALRAGRRPSGPSGVAVAVALAVAAYAAAASAWTAVLLALLTGAAAWAALELWAAGPPAEAGGRRGSVAPVFALLCVAVGLLLPLGTEFVFIRDLFGTRMNTVFKLFYQAWVLLAIGGGYGAFALWRRAPRWLAALWGAVLAALVVAGLVYPAMAVHTRTRGFTADELTLDGLRWWVGGYEGDRAAVEWLKANADGQPVILEAYGGGYEHNGRISMATGFPTVLGWEGHEHQWRGTREEIDPRKADIEAVYRAQSDASQLELLDRYGVRYVVLGQVERAKFGLSAADVERLERNLIPVFEAGGTRLFERP